MRRLLAAYRDARDLIEIGAYVSGTNPLVDRAIDLREAMDGFLRQELHDLTPASDAWDRLATLVGGGASG
jgi:flagellum-specific ATP synthase